MNWTRRFLVLGLAVALVLGVGCSASDTPVSPVIPGTSPGPSDEGAGDDGSDGQEDGEGGEDGEGEDNGAEDPSGAPGSADLLLCLPQPYIATTGTIGSEGGKIAVGDHELKIPEGALSVAVTITAEQIPGPVNSVRFSPDGLHFVIPAVLTMSYGNCLAKNQPKRIVYIDELLNILVPLSSSDLPLDKKVKSTLDHFSRYAVAY